MSWITDEDLSGESNFLSDGQYTCVLDNCEIDTQKAEYQLTLTWKDIASGKTIRQYFTMRETAKKWIVWQMGVMGINEHLKGLPTPNAVGEKAAEILFRGVSKLHCEVSVYTEQYVNNLGQTKNATRVKLLERVETSESQVHPGVQNHAPPPKVNPNDDLPF